MYEKYVEPYLGHYVKISVPELKITQIESFVDKLSKIKPKEGCYKQDGSCMRDRFYTGALGEAAIEEYLGINFIDWSVGNSFEFDRADLPFGIGIKTVDYGKFPLIKKDPIYPEIMVLRVDDRNVLICGLAKVEILQKYQDDGLILSPNVRKMGKKTGFYGFHALKPFRAAGKGITLLKRCG